MVPKAIWRKSSLGAPEMSFTTKEHSKKGREVNKIKLKPFRMNTEEGAKKKNNYENTARQYKLKESENHLVSFRSVVW